MKEGKNTKSSGKQILMNRQKALKGIIIYKEPFVLIVKKITQIRFNKIYPKSGRREL